MARNPSNIPLGPAPEHDLSKLTDKRSETLSRLLFRNHAEYAVLREPSLLFHNHLPHALGSSYLLGASSEQLEEIYSTEESELSKVASGFPRRHINPLNWRNFINHKDQTVAFVDFFDGEVIKNGGDWKAVMETYLFQGHHPLIHGFSGGLGHPFIHLAYAYEFQSSEVASEALSLGCTEYDYTHRYLDTPQIDNSTYKTEQLEVILCRIGHDARLDGMFKHPGFKNIASALQTSESVILEHWNALEVTDWASQLEEFLYTASIVAISTGNQLGEFDFYLIHVLTMGHALRILLPLFPTEWRKPILRQFVLYAILVYIAQLRPKFSIELAKAWGHEVENWAILVDRALNHKSIIDVHFSKVVRALRAAEDTCGAKEGMFLKAASKFVTEFNQWTGFGLGVDAIP